MDIVIIAYIFLINILAFILYGVDKKRARKEQYRISEKTLIIVAVIGGSLGANMGMTAFHHKTVHKKFYLGVPLIIFIQAVIYCLVYLKIQGYI